VATACVGGLGMAHRGGGLRLLLVAAHREVPVLVVQQGPVLEGRGGGEGQGAKEPLCVCVCVCFAKCGHEVLINQ
jgi:hypothetical protein